MRESLPYMPAFILLTLLSAVLYSNLCFERVTELTFRDYLLNLFKILVRILLPDVLKLQVATPWM